MVTVVTSTIKPSGGDYTTLTAWYAAKAGNLVAADQVQQAECYIFPGGLSDSLTMSGSTTDATRYFRIYTPVSERHDGTPNSGFFVSSTSNVIDVRDNYTRLEGIELNATGTTNHGMYAALARYITMTDCIFKGGSTTGHAIYRLCNGAGAGVHATAVNCLFYGSGGDGISLNNSGTGPTKQFYHCVFANNGGTGLQAAYGDYDVRDCVFFGNTTDMTLGTSGTWNASCDYNATDEVSFPAGNIGNNGIVSITSAAFNNAAGNDFHLAGVGSALYHSGVTVSGVTLDIDGDVYDASTPSVGFDEIVTSGVPLGTMVLLGVGR